MANQKTEVHGIPLKTMDVCLNEYNHDIKPYSGFRKNNSPFYGNVLSPWKTKSYGTLDSVGIEGRCFIKDNGEMYAFAGEGSLGLKIDDNQSFAKLNEITPNTKFISPVQTILSTNPTFPTIRAIFEYYDSTGLGSLLELGLCVSSDYKIGIVNLSNGRIWLNGDLSSSGYRIRPEDKIHFAVTNGTICVFATDKNIFAFDVLTGTTRQVLSGDIRKAACYHQYPPTPQSYSDEIFLVTALNGGSNRCEYMTVKGNGAVIMSMGAMSLKLTNGGGSITTLAITYEHYPFINALGNVAFVTGTPYTSAWPDITNHYGYVTTGRVEQISVGSTSVSITFRADDNTKYSLIQNGGGSTSDCINEKRDIRLGQYECSFSVGTYCPRNGIKLPSSAGGTYTYTKPNMIRETYGVDLPVLGHVTMPVTRVTGYSTASYTKSTNYLTVDSGYTQIRYDADRHTSYCACQTNGDGKYVGRYSLKTGSPIRLLMNNQGILEGISVSMDDETIGTLLVPIGNVSGDYLVSISSVEEGTAVYYNDGHDWKRIIVRKTAAPVMHVFNDRWLVLNITDYYNCFDTETHSWGHFGSDYNDRMAYYSAPSIVHYGTSFSSYYSSLSQVSLASGINAASEIYKYPFISTLFPRMTCKLAGVPSLSGYPKAVALSSYSPDDYSLIDVYAQSGAVDPAYVFTYGRPVFTNDDGMSTSYKRPELEGTSWTYTITLTPSINAVFIPGFVNQGIINDDGYTYLQQYLYNHIPIFAMKFESSLEGITNAFIIQSMYYVIINKAIYLYESGLLSAVVDVSDMQFVGNNPYMAVFWSGTNKTFYKFTGDNILSPMMQADEIGSIITSTFNPNTLGIYLTTDKYILVINQDYLAKIQGNLPYNHCFATKFGLAVVSTAETRLLSYNESDWDILPIELETESYGLGNSIKSVNDCVYIRLFDKDKKEGKVRLSCETLNETSKETDIKEFNITKDMWDKNSSTIFIRYQPKYQAATGFSVRIESPFAIASLQISATPETLQNSKYNV